MNIAVATKRRDRRFPLIPNARRYRMQTFRSRAGVSAVGGVRTFRTGRFKSKLPSVLPGHQDYSKIEASDGAMQPLGAR
jgi:hypothetical protein